MFSLAKKVCIQKCMDLFLLHYSLVTENSAKCWQKLGNTKNKFCVIIYGNDAFGVNVCEFVRDS